MIFPLFFNIFKNYPIFICFALYCNILKFRVLFIYSTNKELELYKHIFSIKGGFFVLVTAKNSKKGGAA